MQDSLEPYVVELLKAKGAADTPEARQSLLANVNAAIDQALIEALPLAQLDRLEAATQSRQINDGLVEQLLAEAHVDPSEIIKTTLATFKTTYLKGAN